MSKPKTKREYPARRKFSLRRDASVGHGQRDIESVYGLPRGSVRLYLPSGRPARVDKSVDALLKDWGW